MPLIECLDRSPSLRDGHPPRSGGLQGPTIKHLARLLTAVGLGSVHAWLKPYRVLSTGERFRADVARAVQEASGRREPPGGEHSRKGDTAAQASSASSRWPLADQTPLVVFDEFTSSLDRTVAKTASAALSRYLRRGGSPRLVALTCHDDILPWLAPDWVVELGGMQPRLTRGGWPPLEIPLRALRVPQSLWREFAAQHYLAGGLAPRRRATRRH